MRIKGLIYWIIGVAAILNSCSLADDAGDQLPEYDFAFIELFDEATLDWQGGFSDYPDSLKDALNFQIERKELSNVFSADNHVLMLSARNPHGDLFYYIAKKFTDLEPSTSYQLSFSYEILIEDVDQSVDSVDTELYLKAGAITKEPETQLSFDSGNNLGSNFVLNADKGENQIDGTDRIYFIRKVTDPIYSTKPVIISGETSPGQVTVSTDINGNFWVIFGVDSKSKAELSFSFNTMVVFFKKVG